MLLFLFLFLSRYPLSRCSPPENKSALSHKTHTSNVFCGGGFFSKSNDSKEEEEEEEEEEEDKEEEEEEEDKEEKEEEKVSL